MKPIGQLCLNCGSSWSDERLAHEKRFKPNLISCCPDREMIDVYTHSVKELTYEDGIEECAQRAEAYAYMSPNFTALAEELRAILRKAQEK